ncbi:flagellar basal body-associated protein FliL [Bradyrhizobium sp. USDA 4369]
MRAAPITIIVALLLILAAALAYAYPGLTAPGDPMPTEGWIALILGVVVSLIVGVGLMALLFYSSRKGYDDPSQFPPGDRPE